MLPKYEALQKKSGGSEKKIQYHPIGSKINNGSFSGSHTVGVSPKSWFLSNEYSPVKMEFSVRNNYYSINHVSEFESQNIP
jgi:hypothetical protein